MAKIFQCKIGLFLLFVFLVKTPVQAQIMAPEADRSDTTQYTDWASYGSDPLYFFYTPDPKGHNVGGDLEVSFDASTACDYTWYKFNYSSNTFSDSVFQELNVITSTYTQEIYDTGGYRVHIKGVAIDTNWYAWVYFNKLNVRIPSVKSSDCDKMSLRTTLEMDEVFAYRDRTDLSQSIYTYNEEDSVEMEWTTSDGYSGSIPASLTPSFAAPTQEARFTITVSDKFGHTSDSYIEITDQEPVDDYGISYLRAVKANFIASRELSGVDDTETDSTGQAPLNVQFINKSENALGYQWYFYNYIDRDENPDNGDTILYQTVLERPADSITYYYPESYDVYLLVEGPEHYNSLGETQQCVDALLKEAYIQVDSVHMPEFVNVFTPGEGSTGNDKFYFEDYAENVQPTSIKTFSIKIYSRWGALVYKYEGSVDSWQGWDGRSGITNSLVKTGVYYYQALFEGYDNSYHKDRKGFVHVFR